jgi:DNA-binding NtrC family response regulator
VLIVDDEPLVCWSLAAGLRIAGFDAVTASSGVEGLALAGRRPHPAVVLLDVRLSHGGRAALIRDLRRAAPACRVLWLTTEAQVPGGHPSDGLMMIRKPFDLAEVVQLVSEAIARVDDGVADHTSVQVRAES